MKIEFIAIKTPVITSTVIELSEIILNAFDDNNIELQDYDIIIIASKIVSMVEGCQVPLNNIKNIREEAKIAAVKAGLDPRFVEVVFEEADEIIGAVPGAVLALRENILQANAGVDQSNAGGIEFLIKLPKDPIKTAENILNNIKKKTGKKIGIIIADSKTHPLRRGTSGFALAVAGFQPIIDDRGSSDIFGRLMRVTTRAIADNLVCGAEILMGESDQKIPIVIARGRTGVEFKDVKDPIKNNLLMKMSPEHCIYMGPLWSTNKDKIK
jgi:coenzyme F420-0:L-glutamate ligase/coenzyme F420-1:gamma-L-glutamate ligase